ncbi:MAG: HEAT repeat domain-containing protein [Candidatus Ozemobacteraceae bacterium]
MPPTRKKQDLILQNLNSIASSVRRQSLVQLAELSDSLIPNDKKIACFTKALSDDDEENRKLARRYLESMNAAPAPSSFSLPSELDSPDVQTGEGSSPAPAIASFEPGSTPSLPRQQQHQQQQHQQQPESSQNADSFDSPQQPPLRSQPAPAISTTIEAPPLDESIDPSLPPVENLKSIPDRLNHIRFLSKNRPSGCLTHLLFLADDAYEEISLTALQALLVIKDPRIPPQVLSLLALPGLSSQRRFLMLKIIMETGGSLEVASLERVLIAEKDVIVKSGLVKVYARIAGDEGTKTLKTCLADGDPRVRANTVEVIEEQNIRSCDEEIGTLLHDPENRVKVNAAKFLVKGGHPEAFQTLRSMLGSQEVWLRDSVIFALGEIGDQASLTLLKAALKDPNQGIRLSVLKALAKINTSFSRETLQSCVNDADAVVAQVARGLWEKIKDQAARPPSPIPQKPAPQPVSPTSGSLPPSTTQTSRDPQNLQAVRTTNITHPEGAAAHTPPAASKPTVKPSLMQLPSLMELPSLLDEEPAAAPTPTPGVPHTAPKPVFPAPLPSHPSLPAHPSPLSTISPQPVSPPQFSAHPAATTPSSVPARSIPHPVPQPHSTAQPVVGPPLAASGKSSVPTPKPAAIPSPSRPSIIPTALPPGMPTFQKPRAAELYMKLCSGNPADHVAAIRDVAFIMGDDQLHLLVKAIESPDENVRLASAKLLSRKKGPMIIELMRNLTVDANPLVSSFAQKALIMLK